MILEEAVTYYVRYRGLSGPSDDFVSDYAGRHVDILKTWPGIRRIVLHAPVAWQDPYPVRHDATDFLAELTFPNGEALREALHSEARTRARADRANLKHGAAMVTHQAMRSLKYL